MDHFYTPTSIATKMVQCVSRTKNSLVADFAVGYGELLRVGKSRWRGVKCIATDINKTVISKLRREQADWLVGNCDFLNPNSRKHCRVLSDALGKVSVVLLNPPFSCRGARHYEVDFNGFKIRCSLALAFVLESMPFLASRGELIALLPVGCLVSQKDQEAWNALRTSYHIQTFDTNGRNTFEDCHAETVIVRIFARKRKLRKRKVVTSLPTALGNGTNINVALFRGKVPMHLTNGINNTKSLPLIHTTELESGEINLDARRAEAKWKSVTGPAVLLPRVGRFYPHKIQAYLDRKPVILSDCVIALKCTREEDAKHLQTILFRNANILESRYGGTCAKYITLESIYHLLRSFGFDVAFDDTLGPLADNSLLEADDG